MLSFRIEERVTDKNCSVTDLKRVWFRPSDAKGARAIDKLPMSNLKQLYRAIESRTFIHS